MTHRAVFICALLGLLIPASWIAPCPADAKKRAFDSGRVSFSVRCNGLILGYRVQALFALPAEELALEVVDANWKAEYRLGSEAGKIAQKTSRRWLWTAPSESGDYVGRIQQLPDGELIIIHLVVMVAAEKQEGEYLNGYRIGHYPERKPRQSQVYEPPYGFIEVTGENQDLQVTPHFKLGQFLCRQAGEFPKYVMLDERLLIKLETLLAKANLRGYRCRTLNVSSGFRTPYYNQKLGNVRFSLHQWGRAADVFIDGNYDGQIDDLNRDGKHNIRDVRVLAKMVESIDAEQRHQDKVGGLGQYAETDDHGAFVHIDVRGEPARWQKVRNRNP